MYWRICSGPPSVRTGVSGMPAASLNFMGWMQGDLILAEPHALVGFAGKRVIEQTMHQKIPAELQSAETALKNGFIDAIVKRQDQKQTLAQLLRFHQKEGEANGKY